jgi:hypothetical protein
MESIDVLKKYKKRKTILNENIKFVLTTSTKKYWRNSMTNEKKKSIIEAKIFPAVGKSGALLDTGHYWTGLFSCQAHYRKIKKNYQIRVLGLPYTSDG